MKVKILRNVGRSIGEVPVSELNLAENWAKTYVEGAELEIPEHDFTMLSKYSLCEPVESNPAKVKAAPPTPAKEAK